MRPTRRHPNLAQQTPWRFQVDKRGRGWLSDGDLRRFFQIVVPDISSGQVRYLQVMLDHDNDGKVSYHDVHHLAALSKRIGLAFPVKTHLDATDVLKRSAIYMFDRKLGPSEFYCRFDSRRQQRLGKRDIATIINVVMKSASAAETRRLANEFMQLFDEDCDGFISEAEFVGAMTWAAIDLHTDCADDGRGLLSRSLTCLTAEHCMLRHVEAAGAPLSSVLQQTSSLTGGQSRRLEMGSAMAAAQHIDQSTMVQLLDVLEAEVKVCKEFEVAYAQRLNWERSAAAASGAPNAAAACARGGTLQRRCGPPVLATAVQAAKRGHGGPVSGMGKGALEAQGAAVACGDAGNIAAYTPPRPAKKIPAIAKDSHLLTGTSTRNNYAHAMIEHAGEMAAVANDVSARARVYPAGGPEPLKPATLVLDRRRERCDNDGGGIMTMMLFNSAAKSAKVLRPASAQPLGNQPVLTQCYRSHATSSSPTRGTNMAKAPLDMHGCQHGDQPAPRGQSALVRGKGTIGGRQHVAFPSAASALQQPMLPAAARRDSSDVQPVSHTALMLGLQSLQV
jgi:Ca2+-binding EF-hand superfamily protein